MLKYITESKRPLETKGDIKTDDEGIVCGALLRYSGSG
jgi:hypothetical protein